MNEMFDRWVDAALIIWAKQRWSVDSAESKGPFGVAGAARGELEESRSNETFCPASVRSSTVVLHWRK